MRILLVEDREDHVELLRTGLNARPLEAELVIARSRDSAIAELEAKHFDLLICDLMIPTVDNGLDTALEHGVAVYEHSQRVAAGLPAIYFSAFGSEEVFEQHVVPQVRQDSPFGGPVVPMLQLKDKEKIQACVDIVEGYEHELAELSGIQLTIRDETELEEQDERLVRICARQFDAQSLELAPLSGGLSGARTFQLDAFDSDGHPRLHAALKTDELGMTDRDTANYQRLAGLVEAGLLAPQAATLRAGASNRGAIVYRLAANHDSLFRVMYDDPGRAIAAVGRLAGGFAPAGSETLQQVSVGDIRRAFVSDQEMTEIADRLDGVDVDAVEQLAIQGRAALVHGDLHGANVLVNPAGQPLVIDFGSVHEGNASFDPIVLELSLSFHPYGRRVYPPVEASAGDAWVDLDRYETVCTAPGFVRACREWAQRVAGSEGELLAHAYSHSVRQFCFDGANHDLALRIALAASDRLLRLAG